MRVSLVIPLWNEELNVPELVRSLAAAKAEHPSIFDEAVLVNNGSADRTGALLDELSLGLPWLMVLHLPQNENYGGGIYQGSLKATGDFIAYIPGDLQYSMADLARVVARGRERVGRGDKTFVVKGKRNIRHDSRMMGLVSLSYTWLANRILGFGIEDVNGLPKMFPKALLWSIPSRRMITFTFDAQVLFVARRLGYEIEELQVEFLARRAGVSSWSGKRIRVYLSSLRQLWQVRRASALPAAANAAFEAQNNRESP